MKLRYLIAFVLVIAIGGGFWIFTRSNAAKPPGDEESSEKATRQKLFDEYTDRVFEARADIATALAAIRSLNLQINTVESAVPIAQHLLDTAREAFQQGNTDVMSYEQARREYDTKLLLLIKLKEQLIQAGSALEIAGGRIIPALNQGENN